jgi:hypothetical protein
VTPLEEQFEILKTELPDASLQLLPSGAGLVTIQDFELPPGWSQPKTTIRFLAPVGYPFAKPDCFWADLQLRLQGGAMPQSTNISAIPEINENHLWFSWHMGPWNPNRDSLQTYFRVIRKRLEDPR